MTIDKWAAEGKLFISGCVYFKYGGSHGLEECAFIQYFPTSQGDIPTTCNVFHGTHAVPKLSSGTGEASASAVHEAFVSWGPCNKVKCISFDMTAANTGAINGVCTLFEQKMGKICCGWHAVITSWKSS